VASANATDSKRAILEAQSRAASSHVDFRLVCTAAEEVYAKPTQLHARLTELDVHFHAETLVGFIKAASLRAIRAKQAEATDQATSKQCPAESAQAVRQNSGAATPSGVASTMSPPKAPSTPVTSSLSVQLADMQSWARGAAAQVSGHAEKRFRVVCRMSNIALVCVAIF
jgi:hypothetical protein